jgi:hypothetical protein
MRRFNGKHNFVMHESTEGEAALPPDIDKLALGMTPNVEHRTHTPTNNLRTALPNGAKIRTAWDAF